MKTEHKAIIERAERMGAMPSILANELLVHDLVSASLFELRNLKAPFSKLNEEGQQEVIERVTEKAQTAVYTAIAIIASRGSVTIPCDVKRIQVDAKNLTVTSTVDAKDENRHGLIDSAGSLCLLVIAPQDYNEGLDFIKPDRDQGEMPLSVSDRLNSMFSGRPVPGESGTDTDLLYAEAVIFVQESRRASISAVQRKLKIGYNRAARMIEAMELAGIVTAMNTNGGRDVITAAGEIVPSLPDDAADGSDPEFAEVGEVVPPGPDDGVDAEFDPDVKAFGEFTYQDASQQIGRAHV